jgi:outer membrane protein assembly factor BamB
MHRRLALASIIFFAAAVVAVAEPWPRFRGPNGTGIADGQNIPVEFSAERGILWKAAIPGVGASSPVVWDRHIFLLTAAKDGTDRALLCLDAQDGSIRWQRKFPAVNVKVRGESSLASATPVVDGEAVYVPIWDGNVVHFTAYTFSGELMWQKPLGRWVSQHGTGSSPVIVGDKVIFAYDMDAKDAKENPVDRPATLMAFSKKTGDLVWETPRPAYRACYAAPFVLERNGDRELIVTSTLSIAAYNPDTGKQLWNWDWGWDKFKSKWPLRNVASSVVADGMLVSTAGDGGGDRRVVALTLGKNGGAPSYAWGDGNKLFPYVPTPLVRGAHIYFVNDRGFAGCYAAKTGKQIFYERVDGATFLSSPVLIDGLIYAPSYEGDVHVFAAEPTFKHLAKNALGEVFRASPAVADGRLYVRGQTHLFCIGNAR